MRFFALALLLACAACNPKNDSPRPAAAPERIAFHPDGRLDFLQDGAAVKTIEIEVAATDSARERGLMERAPLTDEQGMLFVFDYAGPQTFWMASTPASLDIIFVGADSAVVNVGKYTRPFSLDGVSSEGPARFVLETNAGFADRHNVAPGTKLRWRLGNGG